MEYHVVIVALGSETCEVLYSLGAIIWKQLAMNFSKGSLNDNPIWKCFILTSFVCHEPCFLIFLSDVLIEYISALLLLLLIHVTLNVLYLLGLSVSEHIESRLSECAHNKSRIFIFFL